jgi:hypothetical protein
VWKRCAQGLDRGFIERSREGERRMASDDFMAFKMGRLKEKE